MKTEKLRELSKKYGLTKEDFFKHAHYVIIIRAGIDKIQATSNIVIKYDVVYNSNDLKHVLIKATATAGDKYIETFGEASPNNTQNKYPAAMAEKRAMSRAVLKITGLYEMGIFGQDESEDFKRK